MFTERSRRVWASRYHAPRDITLVERATGISRATIQRGLRELEAHTSLSPGQSRKAGGGRKPATALDSTLLRDLDALAEPTALGGSGFAAALVVQECPHARGRVAGPRPLGQPHRRRRAAAPVGPPLQGNVKTREGRQHPDRDAQFRYIAAIVQRAHRHGQPAISVDIKKKELVGDFKNGGRAWRRKGEPDAPDTGRCRRE